MCCVDPLKPPPNAAYRCIAPNRDRSKLPALAEAVGLRPRWQGHKAILTMAILRIRGGQLDYSPAIINSYQSMQAIITLKNIVTNQLCSLPLSLMVQL